MKSLFNSTETFSINILSEMPYVSDMINKKCIFTFLIQQNKRGYLKHTHFIQNGFFVPSTDLYHICHDRTILTFSTVEKNRISRKNNFYSIFENFVFRASFCFLATRDCANEFTMVTMKYPTITKIKISKH